MLGCGAHVRKIALPHVRCACGSACGKAFGTVRAMCVRAACFWVCDVRSHFCTLFGTKLPETAIFCLKNYFRTSFPILEYLFLFYNTRNIENLQEKDWKNAEKMLKKCWCADAGAMCDHLKLEVRTCVRAHLNLDMRGARVATHTLMFHRKLLQNADYFLFEFLYSFN